MTTENAHALAARRREMAAAARRAATHHAPGSPMARAYEAEAVQWDRGAERAEAGDISLINVHLDLTGA